MIDVQFKIYYSGFNFQSGRGSTAVGGDKSYFDFLIVKALVLFSAVQNSSRGDLVIHSLT